ncbi:hypothetical protein M3650_17690 [Paenibacillus sp. MER TA 81-3]|uniref:hypothetical protein n=1 Tax=Paenibacillus sp. MER TA 81-3 TaxID=2939573 RepID=UPI00203BA236|nr:hypothetical protein [Paenibacillus sp. MER TA 81-3]MCM3340422.1 hypothetical protein [Paenibacillus sp. MER TA 81-3]
MTPWENVALVQGRVQTVGDSLHQPLCIILPFHQKAARPFAILDAVKLTPILIGRFTAAS